MAPDARPVGPEPALLTSSPRRQTRWLLSPRNEIHPNDGVTDWRLRLDPGNVGVKEGWPERGLPADTVPAEVPGVWNTTAPGFSGVGWYEAALQPELPPGGTVRLVVGAANYLTDAWLNGVYLGRHEGGYDAFSFRCTHLLRDGENRLTLRIVDPPPEGEVDGLRLRECPTSKESWYGGYGGSWGGVWLERSSSVWIEDVRVHGDLLGGRAVFRVTLASDLDQPVDVTVSAHVFEAGIDTFRAGRRSTGLGEATTTLQVGAAGGATALVVPVPTPRPWSPEAPWCYRWDIAIRLPGPPLSRVRERGLGAMGKWGPVVGVIEGHPSGPEDRAPPGTVADQTWSWFGFRTCELRDGTFYLNGEPRLLKGALLQPTYPRTLAMPPDGIRASDVDLAKRAGLDLLRFHLRPPPGVLLSDCDRQGVMAYVEPPLAWIEPSDRLLEHGRRELAALVRTCGNHPSVVLWGIFNENARAAEAVGGDLLAELSALDPTRPIVENSGGAAVGEVGMWAWGGQSRCWSPGWEAPRPLNDVHVYLANPLRREARRLLTTLGHGPSLDVTPGRPPDERIESRLSADAVLVSEYGCGALPDFDAALEAFGEETDLADASLLRELRDDLALGLAERGLDREIGDLASLVQQTQALQAEGILAQTAALRRNPSVSGLILTQLADAGWEQMAGLVGLWRHPRPALEALTRALRPRLLHAELDDPCSSDKVRIRTWLLEEPGLPPLREPAVLTVSAEDSSHHPNHSYHGAPFPHGPSPVRGRVGGRGLGSITLRLPADAGRPQIRARLTTDGWADEAVCVVRRLPDRLPERGERLVLLGRGLRSALPEARSSVPQDWTGPILAHLPSGPSLTHLARAIERARDGAHLCLSGLEPRSAARLEPLLGLPLAMHGARGNFMGMHHYVRDHPLFAGLGAPCLADSTFAEVLPAWAVEEQPGAEVLAGCFTVPDGGRGFLWRASVQTVPLGRGRLTFWQLGLGQRQGGALGRYLLDGLVSWLE